jgi:hypothetical protein
MSAALVPLLRRRQGWTNEERAQFARIERLLEDAGFAVDIEHGLSDEGDPWCVFCARATGEVLIHVARIDGRVMFDSTALPRPIEGVSFERCAERFFEDVSLPMPVNERRGKVYLHPSAMLASLFITILLYAQATIEQPLFDEPAIDVDDPDAPESAVGPLAVRLKALAQQVAEFVAAPENKDATAQAYVNPAMAAIPAGMALAVIAIAQDLANAAELSWTDEESTALALLASAVVHPEETRQAPPPGDAPAAEEMAEDASAGELPFGESPAADRGEAEAARADEGEAPVDPELAAAPTGSRGDALGGIVSLARLADGLGLVEWLSRPEPEEASGPAARGSEARDGAEAVFGIEAAVAALVEFDLGEVADSFAFDLSGHVVELEVVRVSEAVFKRVAHALLELPGADTLALLGDAAEDGGGDALGAGRDGAAGVVRELAGLFEGALPDGARPGGSGAVDRRALVPDATERSGFVASATGGPAREDGPAADGGGAPGVGAPAPPSMPDGARVVSLEEFEALRLGYLEAVGDAVELSTGAHGDRLFLDDSITEHVRSSDIHVEHVYLEDGSKVSFLGTAWDFDGFV